MSDGAYDVLVIGAGQAGLAAGYHLSRIGRSFVMVDGSQRVGDSWRRRYTSLKLFTPRSLSALPGVELSGEPEGYATGDEFADYLESYASNLNLPVITGARVEALVRDGGTFHARLADGSSLRASAVIVASGGFQQPTRPALSGGFDAAVQQFDPETYRNAADVSPGRVLVVGDGASGRDIAIELAKSHDVFLATGKRRRLLPERLFGRSMWWWLRKLGFMQVKSGSILGRLMRRADPFPDRDRNLRALRAAGVSIKPRLVQAAGATASFTDGSSVEVSTVVWAVGYRDDFSWIDIPEAKDDTGSVRFEEGISPVEGLYFVGRPWQRNRASGLVMGVSDDAALIVSRIAKSSPGNQS